MSQTPYDQEGEQIISPHPAGDWHTGPEGESPVAAPPEGAADDDAAPQAEPPVDTSVDTPVDTTVDTDGAAVDEGVTVELVRQLDERTADLQRLQAEYVNYKRRVERDREVVRDTARATLLTGLLSVLDDVDRARQHGELTGGFKAVAESLDRNLGALGLERFGEPGEPFDPRVHEALMHDYNDEVDGPTAHSILQPGYRVGDRVLRPARVAVAEPPPDRAEPGSAGGTDAEQAPVAGPDAKGPADGGGGAPDPGGATDPSEGATDDAAASGH